MQILQQWMLEAVRHHQSGYFQEAVSIYGRVLAEKPDHADALHLSGVAAHQTGRHETAVQLIQKAIDVSPQIPMFYYNLGAACHALDKYEAAIRHYQKALSLNPGYAEVYSNMGNSFKSLGKIEDAVASYKEAIRLKPDFADAYNNLGTAYNCLHHYQDALVCFRKTLELNPECVEVFHNIGNAYKDQGQLSEAVLWYQKALALQPGHPEVYNNLGHVLQSQGKVREALSCFETAVKQKPGYAAAHSNLLFGLNYRQDEDPVSLFQRHLAWDIQHGFDTINSPGNRQSVQGHDDRIHIGYLSPDFRQHSVAYFIEPVLKAHDPGRFKVTCYSDTFDPDEVTRRIKGIGWQWRDVFGISDAGLFDLIQTDGVHILIDLAGHTANNRLKVFARKPAPVQVAYLGYPNTTGLRTMDYRITDGMADPPGEADALHTEKLIRLSGSFLCYQPSDDAPEVSELPALKSHGITFASFNNRTKITETVIHIWATILNLIPGARLILKSRALADPETCQELIKQFEVHHVNSDQLELIGFLPFQSHLALYHRVDVALDTFPYNGTTTTCEALWMGVPVIGLAGNTHASRVGVSLLTSVGLGSFIAGSVDDYIQKAITLSQDLPMLSSVRSRLREMMRDSPLMDAKSMIHSLEQAYESIWTNCRNQQQRTSDYPSKF
ncbi:MAG: tetratricopeptide repeat protein [Deltaproteobacteria bacterium]|nr:tetratricopeptide repeat protein [Deltaproteobacteria bacterium]